MRTIAAYLVVKGSGELRTTRRRPRLSWDEIAFPLSVRIPDVWGRVQPQPLTVDLPSPIIEAPVIGENQGELPVVALVEGE